MFFKKLKLRTTLLPCLMFGLILTTSIKADTPQAQIENLKRKTINYIDLCSSNIETIINTFFENKSINYDFILTLLNQFNLNFKDLKTFKPLLKNNLKIRLGQMILNLGIDCFLFKFLSELENLENNENNEIKIIKNEIIEKVNSLKRILNQKIKINKTNNKDNINSINSEINYDSLLDMLNLKDTNLKNKIKEALQRNCTLYLTAEDLSILTNILNSPTFQKIKKNTNIKELKKISTSIFPSLQTLQTGFIL